MTIEQDIYALFEQGHEADKNNVKELGERIASVIGSRLATAGKSGSATLRASNVGRPCDRQLWYECNTEADEKEKLMPHTKIKFMYGDILEELLLFLVREAGHTVTDEQKEIEVNGIKGHMDCKIDGVVMDVKSASSYAFKKFSEGTLPENDSFGYMGQLSMYRDAEEEHEAGFLAIDKQNGTICCYYPPEEAFIDTDARTTDLKNTVLLPEPPDRCFDAVPDGKSGNMKLCVECSYCGYKKTCWPELRTFLYSHKPVDLVVVKRLPKVMEIT